mgnify:CR=1 FL=1
MEHNNKNLLIDIRNLTWGYTQSASVIFSKFNFSLEKNEFRVVMGRSGVWKSTLVKLIIGQLKAPKSSIFYKWDDVAKYNDEEVQKYRRKVWVVFQDYNLLDSLSVKENIEYPLRLYGVDEKTIETKFKNIIQKLEISKIIHSSTKHLSSWEKQKVCIARALIHDPEFLIADEPTWNLDREHTQQVADLLIEANKLGNAVLLITHDIHLLNYLKEKHEITINSL